MDSELERMIKALIALIAIVLFAAGPAFAQTLALYSTSPPATASAVTPDEAKRALEVLQDPAKRAALIETLQTIAKASPAPTPSPATAVLALRPDSLGAEFVVEAAQWAQASSKEVLTVARVLTKWRALWRGLNNLASDPQVRAEVLEAGWRTVGTFIPAVLAELLLALALRRPMAALAQRRAQTSYEPTASEVEADDRRLLRRLPMALLRLALMLLPIAAFVVVGLLVTFAQIDADDQTRMLILEVLKAYALCRAILALARTLASSDLPRLRLLRVGDKGAAFIESWTLRLGVIIVGGATLAEVADLLGHDPHLRRALVRLVALVINFCLVVIVLQSRKAVASRLRVAENAHGVVATLRNRLAEIWHFVAIATVVGLWILFATRAHNESTSALQLIVISAAALVIARLLAILAFGALDRVFHARKDVLAHGGHTGRYYTALHRTLSATLVAAVAVALLEIWGVDAFGWFAADAFGGRLLSALLGIGVAAAAAALIWDIANSGIDRHLDRLTHGASYQRAARLRTLLPILRTVLMVTILTVLALTALSEIGVNIAPLLAGAGIVGIAVGFGSQKLVQDLITGLFLLLENAIQVGDWVTAAGLSGSVEALSIRTMRLRAADGSVHIVPFSSVTSVTNANRGLGNAAISVRVNYDEDIDRVEHALKEIAAEMRRDQNFRNAILGDIQMWGVDTVDGAGATVVGQIACTDAGRWTVQREFNRRMKQRFQELGIRIAQPASTVVLAPVFRAADMRDDIAGDDRRSDADPRSARSDR
jgi:small-conductance mechanosensitive channel